MSGRFTDLPERLRETTEAMACLASVDMGLWNAHSNAALDAALKIEALERDAARLEAENERLNGMMEWRPIDTAPKGKPRKPGCVSYSWMMLACPDEEGGYNVFCGMRCDDEFFAAGTFHRGGAWNTRQLYLREHKVTPTHWMPLPHAPIPDPAGGMPVEVK